MKMKQAGAVGGGCRCPLGVGLCPPRVGSCLCPPPALPRGEASPFHPWMVCLGPQATTRETLPPHQLTTGGLFHGRALVVPPDGPKQWLRYIISPSIQVLYVYSNVGIFSVDALVVDPRGGRGEGSSASEEEQEWTLPVLSPRGKPRQHHAQQLSSELSTFNASQSASLWLPSPAG